MKTVGILGGMGPYATAAFFQAVLNLTPAKKDWDHLRIIIDNNPHIPSRTRHIRYDEPSPIDGMLESCRKLQDYPVDFIAIPCNSAAIFVAELQKSLSVPVLNICEVAAHAFAAAYPSVRRAAVLGGYVTHKKRTYAPFLAAHGIELVDHGDQIQDIVSDLIEELKLGRAEVAQVSAVCNLFDKLRSEHLVDGVVMGCTEFACLPPLRTSLPHVDFANALARHVVRLGRGPQ